MKQWETPKVNELGVQATNFCAEGEVSYVAAYYCEKCGESQYSTGKKPSVCGINGCDGTEFGEWFGCRLQS